MQKPYLVYSIDEATYCLSLIKNVMTEGGLLPMTTLIETCLKEVRNQVLQHRDIDLQNLPVAKTADFQQLAKIESVDKLLRLLTICFMIQAKRDPDGKCIPQQLDKENFQILLTYAKSVGEVPIFLDRLNDLIYKDMMIALDKMKLDSINAQHHTVIQDITSLAQEVFPYKDKPNPTLAKKYHALANTSPDSLGYHLWHHFKKANFSFPGEEAGFIEHFATLHDTSHLISGYNTTFIGEIYNLAFNEAIHPKDCMWQFHPFLMTWQSAYPAYEENRLRTDIIGCDELFRFWEAWQRGYNCTRDHFLNQEKWDFWQYAAMPLNDYRDLIGVPALVTGNFKGRITI